MVSYEPEKTRTIAHAACTHSARIGSRVRGLSRPRVEKNRPSVAMAYGIRAEPSATTSSDPNTDIASAAAISPPAAGPRNGATTSVATADAGEMLATAAGGRT